MMQALSGKKICEIKHSGEKVERKLLQRRIKEVKTVDNLYEVLTVEIRE